MYVQILRGGFVFRLSRLQSRAANFEMRQIFGRNKFGRATNFGKRQVLRSEKFGGASNLGSGIFWGGIIFERKKFDKV